MFGLYLLYVKKFSYQKKQSSDPKYTPARKSAATVKVFFPKKISATFRQRIECSYQIVLPVFPVACSRMVYRIRYLTSCGSAFWPNMASYSLLTHIAIMLIC